MSEEVKLLNDIINKNLDDRHSYVTFSFTTTLAALAISFSSELQLNYWFYLLPFVLLLPLEARIVYARMNMAKMEAYITIFYPNEFGYYHIQIKEREGLLFDKLLGFLVNGELFLLGCLNGIIFAYMYLSSQETVNCWVLFIPILFCFIILLFVCKSYSYATILKNYQDKYIAVKTTIGCGED